MVVTGNASQTHHLTSWESSAGAVLAFVGSTGDGHFASITTAGALSAATAVLTGGIAVNGIASPPAKAALPVTLADVIAILVALGFCASS